MKAIFRLDNINNRYEFNAPDFSYRVAISHAIQKIDKVVSNRNGILELICGDVEEYLDLGYLVGRMGIDWDFSKYDIEVIM